MSPLLGLLLAASIDGQAALRHASALAALGPHPWGSPRNQAAAAYVAAELRAAGIDTVELQPFERHGIEGQNVIATLRGPGDEFVIIAAHHDTAPEAPGAYDDGGGVGILIELARVLARDARRPRTLVFASFDGEEAWSAGKGAITTGSRAYIERLGPRARSLVAAFVIEMSGFAEGTPLLQPIAYPDPRRAGRPVTAPAWLVRMALEGSREAGAPLGIGDPRLAWLYQPGVRFFRVRFYGDDLSFLQSGLPALFASDSSFSAFYPHYHQPTDTADKLDPEALARMGARVLGVVRALERTPRGPSEPDWFAAFGHVVSGPWLLALAALSLLPGLWRGFRAGGVVLGAALALTLLAGILYLRHPVPALWILLVPLLLQPLRRNIVTLVLSLAPFLALVALGVAGWWRGAVTGVWLAPWEIALLLVALGLACLGLRGGPGRSRSGRSRRKR